MVIYNCNRKYCHLWIRNKLHILINSAKKKGGVVVLIIRLCELRTKRGLTYRELSKLSKVSFSQIEKIESGFAKNPGIITLCKLALALEVTLDELVQYKP